jgi:hypothetical protein
MSVVNLRRYGLKTGLVKGSDFADIPYVPPATVDIIETGLLRYYDAGNSTSYPGSGTTWTDLMGSGYNFTLQNGPTYTSSGAGSYFTFDGSNDYANASDAGLPATTTARTIGLWVYPLTSADFKAALFYGTADFNKQITFYQAAGQSPFSPSWAVNLYGPWVGTFNGDNPITTNAWNLLQFRFDGGAGSQPYAYFTNGTKYQNGNSSAINTQLNGNLNIARDESSQYFNCRIGGAWFYNTSLSDSDILFNYNNTKAKYGL